LVLITLLLLGLAAFGGSCNSNTQEVRIIKIGVIGPMQFIQGEDSWHGAQIAQGTINFRGGVMIGEEQFWIELIKAESNEILDPAGSAAVMERLITVDKVDFVVGGFKTEAVLAMQDVAMDYQKIFIGTGTGSKEVCARVAEDYDRYKYWFRISPLNNAYLADNALTILEMAGATLKRELDIGDTLKVAILAEQAPWADDIVAVYKEYLYLPEDTEETRAFEFVGDWRISPTAADVSEELVAIEASGAHFILTAISGPAGITYAKQLGEYKVPVASVGINIEAQKDNFWKETNGYGEYETTLTNYIKGVRGRTSVGEEVVNAFFETALRTPTHNMATFDAIYVLKEAIERAQSLDADAVVAELEATESWQTMGRIVFTSRETETPHDITYGLSYVINVAAQWQDGEMKCVFPWNWRGITYGGAVSWQIPLSMREKYASKEPEEHD